MCTFTSNYRGRRAPGRSDPPPYPAGVDVRGGENAAARALSGVRAPTRTTPARRPPSTSPSSRSSRCSWPAASRSPRPPLGAKVVAAVRTGLCIVGGDVCRPADAAAAGLAPCLTGERWTAAGHDARHRRRPPRRARRVAARACSPTARATVTRLRGERGRRDRRRGGDVQPARRRGGGRGRADARLPRRARRGGSRARARRRRSSPAREQRRGGEAARPPAVRWHAVTARRRRRGRGGVRATSRAPGCDVGAGGAIGLRTEGARRTLTARGRPARPRGSSATCPASAAPRSRPAARRWSELTWEGGTLRELALRTARATATGSTSTSRGSRSTTRPTGRSRRRCSAPAAPGSTRSPRTSRARACSSTRPTRCRSTARGLSVAGRLGVVARPRARAGRAASGAWWTRRRWSAAARRRSASTASAEWADDHERGGRAIGAACGLAPPVHRPPALGSSDRALPVRRPDPGRARAARAARHRPRRPRLRARQPARDGEGRAVRPLLALSGHAAAAVPRRVRRLAARRGAGGTAPRASAPRSSTSGSSSATATTPSPSSAARTSPASGSRTS